jgi:hypothetical protein
MSAFEGNLMNFFDCFRFESNQLVIEDKTFPLLPVNSPLYQELVFHLQDPSLADHIDQAFEKFIKKSLQEHEVELFVTALVSIIMIFSKKALVKALDEKGLISWVEREDKALNEFVKAAFPKTVKLKKSNSYRICILTTTASGGNASVTRAVQIWLSTFQHVETQVVDVEDIAKKYDAFKIATGKYTYDALYEVFFQKQGAGNDFLILRDQVNRQLSKFIHSRTLEELKKKINEFSPDLLITTRNYKLDDLSVAVSLNIPMHLLYCDYEISFFHLPLIGKTDPKQFKFLLPSLDIEAFTPLFNYYKAENMFDLKSSWEETVRKIAHLTQSSEEEIKESFEEVSFPVGPEFFKVTDLEVLKNKEKWELPFDYSAILITMGKNGVKTLETIFDLLVDISDQKCKYYFVCGTNDQLQERLKQQNKKNCKILGFMNYQEMAELMSISSLIVSKPGGSTVGECQVMGLPMLVMYPHDLWEAANERHLQKIGLAFKLNPEIPLHEFIPKCLKKGKEAVFQVDWKKKFQKCLKL